MLVTLGAQKVNKVNKYHIYLNKSCIFVIQYHNITDKSINDLPDKPRTEVTGKQKLTISSVCFVEEILFKLFLFLCCRIGVIIILRQDYKYLTYVFIVIPYSKQQMTA